MELEKALDQMTADELLTYYMGVEDSLSEEAYQLLMILPKERVAGIIYELHHKKKKIVYVYPQFGDDTPLGELLGEVIDGSIYLVDF